MKRIAIILGVVLLIGAFATVAMARPGGGRHGFGGHGFDGPGPKFWKNPQMVEDLGLTDDQIAALEALDDSMKSQFKAHREQMRTARNQLHDAIQSGDEAAIEAAKAEMSSLHSRMLDLRVEHQTAVFKILTEEQKQKLEDLRPCRGCRGGRGQGGGMGMGNGNGYGRR